MRKQEVVIKKTIIEIESEEQEILADALTILNNIVSELEHNMPFRDSEGYDVYPQDITEACDILRSISITDEIEITK